MQTIPEDQVRGIGMVHDLRKACESNPDINTASLLERYREQPYWQTLAQLANHEHNNLDELVGDDAVNLIRGVVVKIIEDYNAAEMAKAMNELEGLNKRNVQGGLNDAEIERKDALTAYIRASMAAAYK
jgi:hypothetical protein